MQGEVCRGREDADWPADLSRPGCIPASRAWQARSLPVTSPGVFADLRAQRACWHPVAFAADLAAQPAHADLLGEPLVLWRGLDGRPRAMSDLCVHRGTALSLGRVSGDEIV